MHNIFENKRIRRAGFTIIELLVVIAILAVLAGIFFGVSGSVMERGRISRAQTELSILAQYLEQYKAHYGDYPRVTFAESNSGAANDKREAEDGIVALYDALNGMRAINGLAISIPDRGRAFVDRTRFNYEFTPSLDPPTPTAPETAPVALIDPWGNIYRYYYTPTASGWENPSYLLYSKGPDGDHQELTSGTDGYSNRTEPGNLDNIYSN